MSDYVNKVEKNDVEYDIHDERIAALSDIAGLAGNSLVIPESSEPGPEPVATIDGVDYYHKTELHLDNLLVVENEEKYVDIFTGNLVDDRPEYATFRISHSYGPTGTGCNIINSAVTRSQNLIVLQTDNEWYVSAASYLNTAYNITNSSNVNVGPTDGIYLPTCSAYYLKWDDENKILTSYYNLKSDAAAEYVDSIKQGNAVIPLKDSRVPNSAVADAGKIVKVGDDGSYELGEAPSVKDWLPVFDFTNSSDTLQMLIDAVDQVGMTFGDAIHCQVNYVRNYASSSGPGVLYIHKAGGGRPLEIHFTRDLGYTSESQTSIVIMRRWAQGIDPTTVTIGDFFENSTYSGNITLTA